MILPILVLILFTGLPSCGLFNHYKHDNTAGFITTPSPGKYFTYDSITFKSKGDKIRQLSGYIRDSTGRILSHYSITSKCQCIHKSIMAGQVSKQNIQYKLTSELLIDIIPLNKEDSFVFGQFLKYPGIENYCSKELLDSAKGFTKLKNNKKPSLK
ncbi:MAG: hypothetical protein JNK27_03365 [Chitinophagaceae bacterium]|nr:hypothetical protein [Chitinophagaceae bacterium]